MQSSPFRMPWSLVIAIVMVAVAGCHRDAPAGADAGKSASADNAQAPVAAMPATAPGQPPRTAESALPPTPAQYTRAVDTKVTGARFADSGDETKNTLGNITQAFGAHDSVFVEVSTQGTAGDYQISTRWIAPDKTVLLENGRTVADPGPARTVFSLSKPDGWQPGKYTVAVLVNGKPAGDFGFDVH